MLEITVKDNGVGRKQSAEINKKRIKSHVSFATKAISQRLQLLNQSRRNPITINIIDRYDVDNEPLGTTVVINIPF
jgi:peptide subunit release factor 1 (eRF1)